MREKNRDNFLLRAIHQNENESEFCEKPFFPPAHVIEGVKFTTVLPLLLGKNNNKKKDINNGTSQKKEKKN